MGQNHRILKSDVSDPACARNIRLRLVQVPPPARSREFVSPPSVERCIAANADAVSHARHRSAFVDLDGPALAKFAWRGSGGQARDGAALASGRLPSVLALEVEVCVPKTLSALMRCQNRLSWRNDWVALFIPCSRGRANQVEEPA